MDTVSTRKIQWKCLLPVAQIGVGLAVIFAVMGLGLSLAKLPFLHWMSRSTLIPAVGALLALFIVCRFTERRSVASIGLSVRGCLKPVVTGLWVGGLLQTAVIATLFALGMYTVTATAGWRAAPSLLLSFGLSFLAAFWEEVLFRGIIFRVLRESLGTLWAIGLSSAVFGLAHVMNPAHTIWSSLAIVLEAGVLLGAAYARFGTLWVPIGIHWGWNYFQSNIFGVSTSGHAARQSLLQGVLNGPTVLTGGAFGPEASVLAVLFCGALGAWFTWRVVLRERLND